MERRETYEFSDEEIDVLGEALAMYTAYAKHIEVDSLLGDESDASNVVSEYHTSKRLFEEFFEQSNGRTWDREKTQLGHVLGRPADISDVSKYDWFSHRRE